MYEAIVHFDLEAFYYPFPFSYSPLLDYLQILVIHQQLLLHNHLLMNSIDQGIFLGIIEHILR